MASAICGSASTRSLRLLHRGVEGERRARPRRIRTRPDARERRTLHDELRDWERKFSAPKNASFNESRTLHRQSAARSPPKRNAFKGTARALAALDALASFAETSARRRYVRPELHDGDQLEIIQGRHPVIEAFIESRSFPIAFISTTRPIVC